MDIALNETCRIITGGIKPTPLNKVYSLAGIAPPKVRRKVACSVEKLRQEKHPRHSLYGYTAPRARLKSRHSFIKAITALDCDPSSARERLWQTSHPPPSDFVSPKECLPAGYNLQWPTWKSVNRLRSQVGQCKKHLVK